MVRKIIKIDERKCDGCRLCVTACHEGAIGIVDGKAAMASVTACPFARREQSVLRNGKRRILTKPP